MSLYLHRQWRFSKKKQATTRGTGPRMTLSMARSKRKLDNNVRALSQVHANFEVHITDKLVIEL